MDKNLKQAIKSLTATQTRMAIILLRQNGKESALKFIKGVTTSQLPLNKFSGLSSDAQRKS